MEVDVIEERRSFLLKLLSSSDEELRKKAAESLEKLEARLSLPRVVDALKTGDKRERLNAIYSLGKIGGEKSINALYALWKMEVPQDERAAAARALAEIEDPRAMKFFWNVFKEESDKIVKVELLRLLAKWKDRRGVPVLLKELISREADYIVELIKVLGVLGDIRAEPYLLRFASSKHRNIKLAAVEALGNIEA